MGVRPYTPHCGESYLSTRDMSVLHAVMRYKPGPTIMTSQGNRSYNCPYDTHETAGDALELGVGIRLGPEGKRLS